jgi:hypothetical protein
MMAIRTRIAKGNQIRQSIRGFADSSTIENRGSGDGVVSVGKALSLDERRSGYRHDGGVTFLGMAEPPPPQRPG